MSSSINLYFDIIDSKAFSKGIISSTFFKSTPSSASCSSIYHYLKIKKLKHLSGWFRMGTKSRKKTCSKNVFKVILLVPPLGALGTLPPYGLLVPPKNRLLVSPPPTGQHCPHSRKGSVSTGILEALLVVDACPLFEFDEHFLFFFILNWKILFSQNWLNSHFRTHVFLFFY